MDFDEFENLMELESRRVITEAAPVFGVSDFIEISNQTFLQTFPNVMIEGEVASFKVNQGKFVFFDLKDSNSSVSCFMTVWQLRIALEDGMKVVIKAQPKLTNWGKFSLTVQEIKPSGEGSIKKNFDLLKQKLTKEGMFAPEKKRIIPKAPANIGVISSVQAAGYADFIKILDERWGGMNVQTAHVQVQGFGAADQIIRAIKYFNTLENLPGVLVIIRGGGSADDLSVFNDENLVREIAASRIPILTGIGHEIDESLADLAADFAASTPSNAAQILTPDKNAEINLLKHKLDNLNNKIMNNINEKQNEIDEKQKNIFQIINRNFAQFEDKIISQKRILESYNPEEVLRRGFAILKNKPKVGEILEVQTYNEIIITEVKNVKER